MTSVLSDATMLGGSARVLDALPVAVAVVDGGGRLVFVNAALCDLTGFDPDTLVGQEVEVLVPAARRAEHSRQRRRFAQAPQERPMGTGLEITCMRADGTSFPADISLSPLRDDRDTYVVATIRDDTERRATEADLSFRALHDPLTGLANRSLVVDRLEQAIGRARRVGCPVTALFVDLDRFKEVNDRLGHTSGDEVLIETARRLEGAIRPGDTVGRLGGDEFVVVCEGLGSPSTRSKVANRIVRAMRPPIHTAAGVVTITASVGIAAALHAGADDLLTAADMAMYAAKHAGGDRSSGTSGASAASDRRG